ncbi:ComEC/Rec2 family competence protein [bacterium]|nr:ComEC/Rec2 family competence protein [candidate division CSSED10-310 bacterium]
MNRWLIAAASGLVAGIVAVRLSIVSSAMSQPCIPAAILLLLLSLMLLGAKKSSWPLSFLAFFCLGITITSRHLDTSAPSHLDTIVQSIGSERIVNVEGTVVQPPDMREQYTIVALKIIKLTDFGGSQVKISRGLLYARIYPTAGDVSASVSYGDLISLRSIHLMAPSAPLNPGQFDMKTFLNNQGFYATTSVRDSDQIQILASGSGNPLIHVSEMIKRRILITIKQTLPFPESSFLGGVLLGLRSGLSADIKDVFRAAGVSHVLAVSGLHVTIITLFFMGMLKVFRLPRMSSFIIIICALVLFTLITGARPSTVRAAIMNGVTLLFFYFRGIKLDRSLLMGIAIAALYILIRNPLLLTEASFLFSFSAVLSLSLLTRPILHLCNTFLRGFFRIFLFFEILIALGTMVSYSFHDILHSPYTVAAILALVAGTLADRFLPTRFEFRRWPVWLSTFFAAQLAIQCGMLPLTALFFKKISVAAPMANFIAIPLIGVIVQLGLFAGILGFIPVAGPWLALCLNASNWLFIKLFLATATFFGTRFPYPDVSPPTPVFLIIYYSALLLLAFRTPILASFSPRLRYIFSNWSRPAIILRLSAMTIPGIYLIVHSIDFLKPSCPRCEITFLEPSVSYMGGGNAVVVQTPDNRVFLVDAGPRYVLRQNEPIVADIGRRVVIPALLALHARHLDGIVMTSCDGQNIGGISSVIENPWIRTEVLYHALPFNALDEADNTDDILKLLGDPELFQGNYRRRAELTAWALRDSFSAAKIHGIPIKSIMAGDILYEVDIPYEDQVQPFKIRVLNPPKSRYTGSFSSRSNSVVLAIEYGRIRIHLTSNAGRNVLGDIISHETLPVHVVQLPSNGAEYALNADYLKGTLAAVAEPLPSRWAQKDIARTSELIRSMGIDFYSTSSGGAVRVSTDGNDLMIGHINEPGRRLLVP